jgi:hypothetical protein
VRQARLRGSRGEKRSRLPVPVCVFVYISFEFGGDLGANAVVSSAGLDKI